MPRTPTTCSNKLTQEDILSDNPISKRLMEKADKERKKGGGFFKFFK